MKLLKVPLEAYDINIRFDLNHDQWLVEVSVNQAKAIYSSYEETITLAAHAGATYIKERLQE